MARQSVQGLRCVITGASSGIGMECARELSGKGARVIAAARNVDRMREAFAGTTIIPIAADVSTQEGVDALLAAALEEFGDIDLFFANAGFAYHERMETTNWQRISAIYDVNVVSPLYSFQRLKEIKKTAPFSFVITSSAVSHIPLPGYAAYSSTKAAVTMFCDAVRFELVPGQHVISVHPVATRTRFFQEAQAEHMPWPVQNSDTVARNIVRGIERGARRIYPLRLFPLVVALFTLCPPLKEWYLQREWRKSSLAGAVQ